MNSIISPIRGKACPRTLTTLGFMAMVVGGFDLLEGSWIVLAGSGLVALGTFLSPEQRRPAAFRVLVFAFHRWRGRPLGPERGRRHRRLFRPFDGLGRARAALPFRLVHGGVGARLPRWVLWLGLLPGLLHLWLAALPLIHPRPGPAAFPPLSLVLAGLGVLTLAGCIKGLLRPH